MDIGAWWKRIDNWLDRAGRRSNEFVSELRPDDFTDVGFGRTRIFDGESTSPGTRIGSAQRTRRRDARLIILQVLIVALVGTLFLRLIWMQSPLGGGYRNAAVSNSVREVVVPAQRGMIVDEQGRPLVANRSSLSVTVDRAELARQKDGGKAVLAALAAKLESTPEALAARLKSCGTPGAPPQPLCWNGPNQQPVVVAQDVPQKIGLQLMESEGAFKAVRIELTPTRSYPAPYGVNFAHVAGYLGPRTEAEVDALSDEDKLLAGSEVGRSGMEQQYDDILSGRPGLQQVTVSRAGNVTETLKDEPAVAGANVVTSINARLQAVVEQQLAAAIVSGREQGKAADSGAIVVTDVTSGRVLAMASAPLYDPNMWVGGISQRDYTALTSEDSGFPLLNRATQGVYAPASTFKAITTAAAIRAGIDPHTPQACPSSYTVGGQAFQNYESKAYGSIDLSEALAVSCDTVFYRLAHQFWLADGGLNPTDTPREVIYHEAKSFGLGSRTGIDLPAEAPGRLVGRQEKQDFFNERKDDYCRRAEMGYPEVQPKARADLLKLYARDFCLEGDKYRAGDALNFSIGQGDTGVTPLQMATVYGAIANGGTLWKPQIARAVVTRDGQVAQEFAPQSNGTVDADASTLSFLRSALSETTVSGTAHNAFNGFPLSQVPIAAKTGTGEVVDKDSTSWFASFAPATAPRFAVTCMVSQGGTGAETCGPSVRAIYEAMYGVVDGKVNPQKAIFPSGQPQVDLPQINSDGMDQTGNPNPAASEVEVSATPSGTPSAPVVGGESPVQSPSSGGEQPVPPTPTNGEGPVVVLSPSARGRQ